MKFKRIKRKLMINKRNGQASVSIPSKIIKKFKKFDMLPKNVFVEISNSMGSKEVGTKHSG